MNSNGAGKPIVALDLDGTLGDYHTNFLTFADKYFGPSVLPIRLPENPGLPMWEWMGISERSYRDAKLAYRQGGWKRWMPVYPGAAELTREIRSAGAEVWICTTRPYLRLDNVDPDTREWLWRNHIEYDAMLFDPLHEADGSKYEELFRQVGSRVASIVDDLPEMIRSAQAVFADEWVVPVVRDQPYNRTFDWPRRVLDVPMMHKAISGDLKRWRQTHG